MEEFDAFLNRFAELVADKVATRINSAEAWPVLETKDGIPVSMTEVTMEPEREEREPVETKIVSHDYDARRVALGKVDVRTLRKQMAAAGGGSQEEYSHLKKPEMIEKVIEFEKILNRTLEEEIERLSDIPDDNDLTEVEPEDDDTTVELTRETALELDLPKLREIALENGHSQDSLKGLDVEAVVGVIFGDEPQAETSEDEDLTEEDVRAMSLGELKALVATLKEDHGIVIEFDRGVSASDLAEKIIAEVF